MHFSSTSKEQQGFPTFVVCCENSSISILSCMWLFWCVNEICIICYLGPYFFPSFHPWFKMELNQKLCAYLLCLFSFNICIYFEREMWHYVCVVLLLVHFLLLFIFGLIFFYRLIEELWLCVCVCVLEVTLLKTYEVFKQFSFFKFLSSSSFLLIVTTTIQGGHVVGDVL
jgi:hypothetical protein